MKTHAGRLKDVAGTGDLRRRRSRAADKLNRAHHELEAKVLARTRELAEANETLAKELQERRDAEDRVRRLLSLLITVQEQERRRIARELHDHLGQQMTALHLKLEALRQRGTKEPAWQEQFKETQAYVARLEHDLDFFTWELRPAALYDLGLIPALRDFVAAFSKNYALDASFDAIGVGDHRLTADIEINLYRIAQEALNNVHKHAKASKVDLFLQYRNDRVVLSVIDDGVGFESEAAALGGEDKGMGLVGMQERATLVGGMIEIESRRGEGTTVMASVPALFRSQRR